MKIKVFKNKELLLQWKDGNSEIYPIPLDEIRHLSLLNPSEICNEKAIDTKAFFFFNIIRKKDFYD